MVSSTDTGTCTRRRITENNGGTSDRESSSIPIDKSAHKKTGTDLIGKKNEMLLYTIAGVAIALVLLQSGCMSGKDLMASVKEEFLNQMQVQQQQLQQQRGFSACMVTMDDNHLWPEFLAYHYHYLPLRRVIVAVDPLSKTSPSPIFERYRRHGLMNITEWSDHDYLSPKTIEKLKSPELTQHQILKWRQGLLLEACLRTLRAENRTWVALIDTDEYIIINQHASDQHRIQERKSTVQGMLNSEKNWQHNNNTPSVCVGMHRLEIGTKESNASEVQDLVPTGAGLNGSDFLTLRYRWTKNREHIKPGKCMVDVSRITAKEFSHGNHNPHRPVRSRCSKHEVFRKNSLVPFIVGHYKGTFEQFSSRDDGRGTRTREAYDKHRHDDATEDSAKFWLQGFIDKVGIKLAKELLEGSGRVLHG